MTAKQPLLAISLSHLVHDLVEDNNSLLADIAVTGLQLDSRKIIPGDVFIACRGEQTDGSYYIPEAIAKGAVAVIADQSYHDSTTVPVVVVDQLTQHVSEIASRFYQHPSTQLPIVGVTGTNGKTSCTQIMMQLLNGIEKSCAVIGTLGIGIDGELCESNNTTPDALSIQAHLSRWQTVVDCVAMEVSSHGLMQHRVAAVGFDVGLFTNLTHDHLDYHGSMQAYGEAKLQLFKRPELKVAVVNIDDPFSATVIAALAESVKVITYSVADSKADIYAQTVSYHLDGIRADISSPWGQAVLECCLLGAFNLSNVMASIACLSALGFKFESLVKAVSQLQAVPGRMAKVAFNSDITVVVDYAHTPDALEQALSVLRRHTSQQLHCVFGCGGDRDRAKRALMGAIAERLADQVWVTSDNPRHEAPETIIEAILTGIRNPQRVHTHLDRAQAIASAITAAKKGDVILVAGKGHEDYQQIADLRMPFDDTNHVRLALQKRMSS